MQNYEIHIKTGFAVCATGITALLGGWDNILEVLLILICTDYVTGVSKAFYNKCLCSYIGSRGIVKKLAILAAVALATQLDKLVNLDAQVIRGVVIYFYIANEGISILENLAGLGIPLPKILMDRLIQLRDGGSDDNNNKV